MKPVFALVGRPNVGKSTLFNRLTRTRDALVADFPGLTRDRQYGIAVFEQHEYLVIDTGGLTDDAMGIDHCMAEQTHAALQEADAVLFLVDGQDGLTRTDQEINQIIRQSDKPVYLVVNKTDRIDPEQAKSDFYALGVADVCAVSATQGRGIHQLMTSVLSAFPDSEEEAETDDSDDGRIKIAFVGRPNVGKSTLINRILGEERVIAFDQPGTTRDSIYIPFERDERAYTLIDTAGVRRKGKTHESIEKFSIVKTLEAIRSAHVVILLLDAQEAITEQDAHLLGLVLDIGKALVVAINKWDGLDEFQREQIKQQVDRRLSFLPFAEKHCISALHGSNVGLLHQSIHRAYKSAMLKVNTARLTHILETAIQMHQPPLIRGRRIKLRYAHQGGSNPFTVIIHGNQTNSVPNAYTRYLVNYYQKTLKLIGSQVRVEYKGHVNPYEGRRNKLTPRQAYKKKRLMRFVKSKKS